MLAYTTLPPVAQLALVLLRTPVRVEPPVTSFTNSNSGNSSRSKNSIPGQGSSPNQVKQHYRRHILHHVAVVSMFAVLGVRDIKRLHQQPRVVASLHVVELLLLGLAISAQQNKQAMQKPQQQERRQLQQHLQLQPGCEQLLLALGMPAVDITAYMLRDMPVTCTFKAIDSVFTALDVAMKGSTAGMSGAGQGSSSTVAGSSSSDSPGAGGSTQDNYSSTTNSTTKSCSNCNQDSKHQHKAFLQPHVHLPLLCSVLELLLLQPGGIVPRAAQHWAQGMDLANTILADKARAAPQPLPAVAASSAPTRPYSHLLAKALQLAPAVFALVEKCSSERRVPAASDPEGADSMLLSSFGGLIYNLCDKPKSAAGGPCWQTVCASQVREAVV